MSDAEDQTPDEPHDPTGLDLAKRIARGLSGSKKRNKNKDRIDQAELNRRNQPYRPTGAHPDERDPQTLDSLLDKLVQGSGWTKDLESAAVFARWGAIVGRDVAEHSRPISLIEEVLLLQADSTAWATQLRLLAPAIVKRLNEELGDGSVRLVEVEGPRGPSWRKGKLRVKGRGPRDTYG